MRRFHVTPGGWLALALLWALDPTLLLWTIPAAALHEGGHIALLRALGAKVEGVTLSLFGLELKPQKPLSYGQELPAALAGPAASLLLALLAARLKLFLLAGLSLALGVFNLLPVFPLDGGRAVRSLCALVLPPGPARWAPRWVGILTAAAVTGLALALFLRRPALTLLLPALWLLCQVFSPKNR